EAEVCSPDAITFGTRKLMQNTKRALDPVADAALIRELKLAAIQHRRELLALGRNLGIRLHYGATMSSVEILTTLYRLWLRVNPDDPQWPERDRFVLSKGHAAPGLYVALAMRG